MPDTCSVCGLHPYERHGYVADEPAWHAAAREIGEFSRDVLGFWPGTWKV